MSAQLLTDADFKAATASGPVLVDFFAEWCGPCKTMSPIIDSLVAELTNVKVVKVDVDKAPLTARSAGVRGLPTFAILVDGHVVAAKTGSLAKKDLKSWVETTLA
jgi:thioredoxin 1